ncbi:UDP-N-acetylmuramoyl-tripeptide--D-alanyl-D-alanine ligase [Marinicella sp. S1101]|uniref:UDP-N-acetylmuramoyl-tripeptide--D-alanyl-D- alanine ligase n=1 Tax=Marinicella marina TaxID=2996016 RepID=UPI002260E7C4|nr:UDP-N-acetylmuramoyl-tripeptide--D-alanyl-D-alanine ligase [Marinicella marina]MCX7553880.1 UDP-N-acetylmuramoyl-tripeptide--D-alanyl-D-alanine ligase [Marinicella marina]MDJ1140372.1 UDP-N-acetylmuramoyl-tripeptide--D-alanyl-D-alanine ligase [Marinicella marina]
MIQMNLHQISAVVGGNMVGKEARIQGVTTDSRGDCQGKLFVALKGEFFDGEAYCQQAVDKGAAAVLVANAVEVDVPQLIVKDTLVALQAMSTAWVMQTGVKVIGITGSNGKTTVKNMLHAVLSQKYQCYATAGNFNNEIGVPLSLLSISTDDQVAVIEMGAAKIGDVAALTEIIKPDIAIITNIGDAHVGRFGGVDNIAKGKAEIYQALDQNGKGVVNADCAYADDFKEKIRGSIITFGQSSDADFRLVETTDGYQVLTRRGESIDMNLPLLGLHNFMNATAVLAIGLSMRLTVTEVLSGLREFQGESGRLEVHDTEKGMRVIDDSYNANPTSVKAAIDVLIQEKQPTTLVLGDMLELGEEAQQLHSEVGHYAAKAGVNLLLAVGEYAPDVQSGCTHQQGQCQVYQNVTDLLSDIEQKIPAEGTVLVKGSRSMRLERVVKKIVGGEA